MFCSQGEGNFQKARAGSDCIQYVGMDVGTQTRKSLQPLMMSSDVLPIPALYRHKNGCSLKHMQIKSGFINVKSKHSNILFSCFSMICLFFGHNEVDPATCQ